MPEMSGKELAKNVQLICPAIRCMFMSGYTADIIVKDGVLDEGIRFIQKPFSKKELSEKVRKALVRS